MSFDVRYEKFRIIRKPDDPKLCPLLLNYQGKLAWVCEDRDEKKLTSSLRFWILEDEEKQEWSLRVVLMPFQIWPRHDPIWRVYLSLEGVTQDTGEFIYVEAEFEAIYVIYLQGGSYTKGLNTKNLRSIVVQKISKSIYTRITLRVSCLWRRFLAMCLPSIGTSTVRKILLNVVC